MKKKSSTSTTPKKNDSTNTKTNTSSSSSQKKPTTTTTDSRFDRVAHDPRFARALSTKRGHAPLTKGNNDKSKSSSSSSKTKEDKIVVDKRFSSMFSDPEFLPAGGLKSTVDKRGRKLDSTEERPADVTRYYELEESQDGEKEKGGKLNDEDESVNDKERLERLNKLARGEIEVSSSSDEDDEDEREEDENEEQEKIDLGEATSRLACVNCNWDHTRAVDILAVLESFCPSNGSILDVSVYPSQFGKERMAIENVSGPIIALSSSSKTPIKPQPIIDEEEDDEKEGHEEGEGFDPEALRAYEKSRLRYYFAVITCDSKETASTLYDECDGLEFGHSAITFDMRFIPDEQDFNKEEIRDLATFVPEDYAPIPFETKALQQTSVSLTWDDHEFERTTVLENWDRPQAKTGGPITTKQLEQYIASSSESEGEEEDDEKIQRIRALLNLGAKQKEMVSEKKKKTIRDEEDEEEEEEEEESGVTKKVSAGKKRKNNKPLQKSTKGEEYDDSEDEETYKSAKRRRMEEEKNGKEVDFDAKDERFAGLFNDPSYALDRSDPKYQATKVTKSIDREVEKRRSSKNNENKRR